MADEKVQIIIEGRDKLSPITAKATKSLGGLGSAFKDVTKLAAGFAVGMVGFQAIGSAFSFIGSSAIGLNNQLEQSRIAFGTMLGSADKAQAHLDELAKFAAKTPFEFPEIVTASKRLQAFGFQASEVLPMMSAIGDAAAAMGGGGEMVGRITTALGQMSAKGKVSAEEMLQLTEAGIPAWDMLAKKLGVDVAGAMEMVTKRTVDSKSMLEAFQAGVASRFGGQMEQQSRTFAGAMSTIKDSLAMAIAKGAKPFFDLLTKGSVQLADLLSSDAFSGAIERVSDLMVGLSTGAVGVFRAIGDLVGVFTGAENAGLQLHNALESIMGLNVANALIWIVQGFQRIGEAIRSMIPEPLVTFVANLRESIDQSGILGTVGQALAGIINVLARGFVDLTKFIEDNKVAQAALVGILGSVATAWTILKVAALAHTAIMGIQATATGVLTAAQMALNFALTANPIGIIVVALAGLVAGLVYAYNTSEEFRAVVDGALKTVGAAFDALLIAGRAALDFLGDALKTAGNIANTIGGAITATWDKVPLDIRKDLELIGSTLVIRFKAFLANTSRWLSDTWATISRAWADITSLTERAWSAVLGIFTTKLSETGGALGVVTGFVGNVLGKLGGLAKNALELAAKIGQAIIDGIRAGINAGWQFLMDLVGNLARDLLNAAKRALGISSPSKEFFKVGQNIIDGITEGVKSRNTSFLDAIRNTVSDSISLMEGLIDRTIGGPNASILSRGASAADTLQKLISDKFSGSDIQFGFPNLPGIFSQIGKASGDMAMFGQIKDVVGAMKEMGIAVDQDVIQQFKNLGQELGGPFKAMLDRFFDTLDQQDALKGLKDFLADADLGRQLASTASMMQSLGQAMPDSLRTMLQGVLATAVPGGVLATIIQQLLAGAIPGFASGVRNFSGGLAVVGERGAELVNLPRGSNIYSNSESRGIARQTVNVYVTVQGTVTAERDLAETVRRELIRVKSRNVTSGL